MNGLPKEQEDWIWKHIWKTFEGIRDGIDKLKSQGYLVGYPDVVNFEIKTNEGNLIFSVPFNGLREEE